MINYNNYTTQKVGKLLYILMFATAIFSYYGLSFPQAPSIIKIFYSSCMWLTIILFPYRLFKSNDLGKNVVFLIKSIVLLVCIAILRSVFSDNEHIAGNKWISLFGNDQFFFMLLIPLYMLIGTMDNVVRIIKRYLYIMLLIGVWGIFFEQNIMSKSLFLGAIFFPYVEKKYQCLICVTILQAVIAAFYQIETSRTMIIVIALSITSYILVYKIYNTFILKIYTIALIIIPVLYCLLTLFIPDFSIIEILLSYLTGQSSDTSFTTDTRSFLFWELASDLTESDAWIWGKGAYSAYYSSFFDETGGDSEYRMAVEVTFLTYILRCGLLFIAIYYSLITIVVWKAINKGKSKFIRMCAVMGANWCLVSYISHLNGYNFIYVSLFILLGCCASKKWLQKSDNEIKQIFVS